MRKFNYVLIVCDLMDCYICSFGYILLDDCMTARDKLIDKGYKASIYKGEIFENFYINDHAMDDKDLHNIMSSVSSKYE